MKAKNLMLALLVLPMLGTGAVNAATYNAAVTELDFIFHFPDVIDDETGEVSNPAHYADILIHGSSYGIPGSAVLDDSGTLTISSAYKELTIFGTNTLYTNVITIHGLWDGTLFTAANGFQNFTSCVDSPAPGGQSLCSSSPPNYNIPLAAVVGSVNVSGGALDVAWGTVASVRHYQYVLSNGAPAVPLPATAWLFGSGLLGTFGVTRRRRCT